ncbi:MAG: metalloregulator ArsR/SmtB family transcription factor [Patescibacteria group bacterium]|nr:metalloregulator ArsR/SmtB family transcription factor [Patescibacteria group bacterium]
MKGFKKWCPECFKALSTKVRAGIVNLLSKNKEMTVGQIAANFRLKQPTISYHLSELEKSGLLSSRSFGRHVYYKLSPLCPYDRSKCLLK